jgi:hypothetical protein
VTPSALGWEECLKIGSPWVHLRLCRTCGHVGCCDDSPRRHVTPPNPRLRATLFFLPHYSPDLNPIEQIFAKLETLMRKTDPRTIEATWRGIGDFLLQGCAHYLANTSHASA